MSEMAGSLQCRETTPHDKHIWHDVAGVEWDCAGLTTPTPDAHERVAGRFYVDEYAYRDDGLRDTHALLRWGDDSVADCEWLPRTIAYRIVALEAENADLKAKAERWERAIEALRMVKNDNLIGRDGSGHYFLMEHNDHNIDAIGAAIDDAVKEAGE